MDTKPISLRSEIQPNVKVRFIAYDDPILLTGRQFVEEVTTNANGIATLTATPPAGKTLTASVHLVDNGTAYSRFRVLTDTF